MASYDTWVTPAPGPASARQPEAGELELRCHRESKAFESLRDDWIGLESRAAEDNIFLTYLWQHTWWDEFQHERELELIAFYDGDRVVAIAPTYRERVEGFTIVRFGGGLEVTDYLGFIVESGYERQVGKAFLEHSRRSRDLLLDFHYLRADGVTLRALKEAAESLELEHSIEVEDVSPRITITGDWEQHLAGLSKKDRHELRRKRRRLEEAGGWSIAETSAATLAADLETFFSLHAKSTRAKADFMTEDVKAFFRHISVHLQEAGWLSLRHLVHQDRAVASVLGFVYRGKLHLYNSGYDPEYNRLSAGFVLMSEEIRLAIQDGLEEVDFLRGDEKYKYDLGASDVPLMHLAVLAE